MNFRKITASVLALSVAATLPVAPAMARTGDAIVGGIIGGIIGGAIVNESQKGRKAQPQPRAAARPDPAREARRDVQRSLNYFGFNAGTPDGAFGRNTRTAISQYQATLGYPVTGELTAFQQDFLVQSWRRGEAGGATVLAQIAQNPRGAAGVLVTWHGEMLGVGAPPAVVAAAPAPVAPPFLPQRPEVAATPAPGLPAPGLPAPGLPALAAEPAPAPAAPSLPGFMGGAAPVQVSLASHCSQVSLVTNSNGGFATLVSMTDPAQALAEQFCLARTYAISDGEQLAASQRNISQASIAAECAGFGPFMATPVALLASQAPAQAIPAAAELALSSGMSVSQLSVTAKICLSSGYRTDDTAVALGSALVLASLGELPYAELIGHHLLKGFGTGTNPALARDWFRIGVDAVQAGQPAAFAPGQPERVELIEALVFGKAPAPRPVPTLAPGAEAPAARLPGVFATNN